MCKILLFKLELKGPLECSLVLGTRTALLSDTTAIKAVAASWAAGTDRSHPGCAPSACRQWQQPQTAFIWFTSPFSMLGKRHQKKSDVSLRYSRSIFLYEHEASYRCCDGFKFQQRGDPALRKVKYWEMVLIKGVVFVYAVTGLRGNDILKYHFLIKWSVLD